jgi:MSHA pilin protein MshC
MRRTLKETMNLFHKKAADNRGFTLIEVIAVLIIFGILAAVAVSRVMSNQNDLILQADIVKSHLRFAQLKALADESTSTSTWGIAFTGTSYTLQNNGVTATTSNLPGEDGKIHTFPSSVTIGNATVTFDSWGSPGPANVTVTLTQDGVPKTITITNNTGYITP